MSEALTGAVIAWATETARVACGLASSRDREAYLADRRAELIAGAKAEGAADPDAAVLADACVDAARRIMLEMLSQRAGEPKGHA